MRDEQKVIGLLVGTENSFPPALINDINARQSCVTAEYVKIGGLRLGQPIPYEVILDRISHHIPFYRSFLKAAVLAGVKVVNNPFWSSADDKFFNYSLAGRLGVATPRTVLLPQKAYKEGVSSEALRNLKYPLDWDSILEYVGLPAVLKPVTGGGWRNVSIVDTREQLMLKYDSSGSECMVVQQFLRFDRYVRVFCVGDDCLPIPYDPVFRRYLIIDEYLDAESRGRILRDCRIINNALGYEMNTAEFAIVGETPFAIDYMNPAPDADWHTLGPRYFNWVVKAVANFLISKATDIAEPRAGKWLDLLSL